MRIEYIEVKYVSYFFTLSFGAFIGAVIMGLIKANEN